jgi:hypothetical protein
LPLVRTPQVWMKPALMEVNVPPGGLACPPESLPQQATAPLVLTPHVWAAKLVLEPPLALTELNVPGGGLAWP